VLAGIFGFITFITVDGAKAEHWSSSDDPSLFASDLINTLDDLPKSGEANKIPWAGSYWPTYKDSINDPWEGAGTKPPSQKYAEAFNYDTTQVMDHVSLHHGIDSQSHRRSCINNSRCTDNTGTCSKQSGNNTGYCIPTWFGIIHAWAPASILLAEPKHEVELNGVNFKVNDTKALISLIYNRTVTRFISLTNPGTLHLLLANYLGIRHASFVEDRTWDYEVWNQPLRGYRIIKQTEVTAKEANQLIGVTETGGTTASAIGNAAKNHWFHMDPIPVESGKNVSVTMNGTNDADLYVRFGSQPTSSDYDCRPYTGGSDETCQLTSFSNTQVYISVQGYADSSDFIINANIGGSIPNSYQFNSEATDFRHVKIEVDYIATSASSTGGYLGDLIDRYTHTDTYEYILELKKNGDGKLGIIGGEYIGSSKRNHPDFLWLPISHRGNSVAGGAINRSGVMAIYEKSQQPDRTGGADKLKVVNYSDTIANNDVKHYGPYNVKVGKNLSAVMTGTNDADLYVRIGSAPTNTSYDCRPYKSGSNEECQVVSPGAPIYVAVMGYAASSDFSLRIEYVEKRGSLAFPTPATEVPYLNIQDTIDKGNYKHYTATRGRS
jgi:hypothetical protein